MPVMLGGERAQELAAASNRESRSVFGRWPLGGDRLAREMP